ncbi:unnamed protein product, partial [Nesidiocoris tenuis]
MPRFLCVCLLIGVMAVSYGNATPFPKAEEETAMGLNTMDLENVLQDEGDVDELTREPRTLLLLRFIRRKNRHLRRIMGFVETVFRILQTIWSFVSHPNIINGARNLIKNRAADSPLLLGRLTSALT